MPLPNEYSCRLVSPDRFKRFARMEREHEGKKYSVIIGWPGDGDDGSEDQAYRYHKDTWTEAAVRSHCQEKKGTFEPLKEEAPGAEELGEEAYYINLFVGSPRNLFGTHNSFRFKGGAEGYKKAWTTHFSQVNGGALTPAASGPIRGTVRRIAMIVAGMKPSCDVVESKGLGPRGGAKSPLPGSYPQKPSDYDLPRWLKPGEENVDREEALRFTCSDLNVIKRVAVAEIKRRIKDREKKEGEKGINDEEKEFFEWLGQQVGITDDMSLTSVQAKEYRLAFHIKGVSLKEHRASVELLPEGEWKHESAPGGILKVPLLLMQEFIKNFQDRICGEKLPLDYGHEPDDKAAPGWITNLKITKNEDGGQSIFATLDITDPEAQENIQNGSLCYISPQLILGWEDPETGETYNVIRSAALTNYPYIKNMRKIIANFEEVSKEVKKMLTAEEIKVKENELEVKETELSKKEKGFVDQEAKLKEGEEALGKEKKEFEGVKLEQDKHPKPFFGLSKDEAVALADKCKAGDSNAYKTLMEHAKTQLQEDLKVAGVDIELGDITELVSTEKGEMENLTKRVATLEKEKNTATTAFKDTVEELNNVTHELREKKVETKLDELIRNGVIVPAGRGELKSILMADKTSGSIELTDEKDGKITKKKVSMAEAMLSFLEKSPAGVKLGQEGVLIKRTAVSLAEGLKKLAGMSQAEFNKLEPEVQTSLLKKIEGFKS